jgi:hypothetical protein
MINCNEYIQMNNVSLFEVFLCQFDSLPYIIKAILLIITIIVLYFFVKIWIIDPIR